MEPTTRQLTRLGPVGGTILIMDTLLPTGSKLEKVGGKQKTVPEYQDIFYYHSVKAVTNYLKIVLPLASVTAISRPTLFNGSKTNGY